MVRPATSKALRGTGPDIQYVTPANAYRDVGGTSPWTGEGRTMQEQLSRATHDCMDAGGRAMHGAIAEDAKAEAGVHSIVIKSWIPERVRNDESAMRGAGSDN